MKLSMWILAEWLEKYKPIIMINEGEPILRGVRLFSGDMIFEKQNVYLGLAREYVSGYEDEIICVNGKDMIVLQTNNIELVMNDIFSAFDFYNKWIDGLNDDIYMGCTLQHIVDVSTEVFDDPVIVFDYSYIVLAMSSKYGVGDLDEEWDYLLSYKSNKIEMLTAINSYLHKSRKIRSPQYVCFDEIGIPCLLRNLFENNVNKGLLLIVEYKHPITTGRNHLCEVLGNIIERWIKYNKEQEEMRDEYQVFLNLIQNNNVIKEDVIHQLDFLGWKDNHSKIVLKLETLDYYEEKEGPLRLLLENNYVDCFTMSYESSIVMIINLNLLPLDRLVSTLKPILKKSNYYCGLSYEFSDIFNLNKHYEQCSIALKYCNKKSGELYYCVDYALQYMFSMIESSVSPIMAHPALQILKEYDAKNKSELYNTLYLYLDNERSIVKTSAKLNLHRNTLLYRLDKIKQLVELDLEDNEMRAYILISLRLKL